MLAWMFENPTASCKFDRFPLLLFSKRFYYRLTKQNSIVTSGMALQYVYVCFSIKLNSVDPTEALKKFAPRSRIHGLVGRIERRSVMVDRGGRLATSGPAESQSQTRQPTRRLSGSIIRSPGRVTVTQILQ